MALMENWFPIQSQRGAKPHPLRIPWSVAELAYSVYSANYGRGQSLRELAERGGFGPGEMDMLLPDWRERCDALAAQAADIARLTAERDAAVAKVGRLREKMATAKAIAESPEFPDDTGCLHYDLERIAAALADDAEGRP